MGNGERIITNYLFPNYQCPMTTGAPLGSPPPQSGFPDLRGVAICSQDRTAKPMPNDGRCVTVGIPAQRTAKPMPNYQFPIPNPQFSITDTVIKF
ncbi:hypothetical protein PI95_027455 [Hassallia byssoidea VB512170]|uniref:Uncharacterized protein n=1 Tax=Hassallia byssoidea VB512170 TaxID=1304833 RepID=A0A846HFP9_9CYAN|nr:hypothetical protein [Hassalia byssoidea]NEU76162.1 hypothetical protein [Hassalia byssoidea VB512170]